MELNARYDIDSYETLSIFVSLQNSVARVNDG